MAHKKQLILTWASAIRIALYTGVAQLPEYHHLVHRSVVLVVSVQVINTSYIHLHKYTTVVLYALLICALTE
jgi:hypothetical protein